MASIDIFSMANSYHENSNFFVLNFSDDAIISDTILQKASKICGKGLAKLPRVFINGNFILKKSQNPVCGSFIKLRQLFFDSLVDFNYPGQGRPSLL